MRIIFSRKGFDSAAGGCPSPIVDGLPFSLPIPSTYETRFKYSDLPEPIPQILRDLGIKGAGPENFCHYDPYLRPLSKKGPAWRGCLGQVAAAQGHLCNQKIGPGDLFIFWGLFQNMERNNGKWKFVGRREHRIFGWLQIEEVITVGASPGPTLKKHPWLADHPHLVPDWHPSNTIYIARERLAFPRVVCDLPGWGVMTKGLTLTASDSNLSTWRVPSWLKSMTYNPPHRWAADGTVTVASRGQEFIAHVEDPTDALRWFVDLIEQE